MAIANPKAVVDVYRDPAFQRVASFGNDLNAIDVFRSDFRAGAQTR
jgi:hypothetical protein